MSKHAYETHPHLYVNAVVQTGANGMIVENKYINEREHKASIKELVRFSAKTGFPLGEEAKKFVEIYGITMPKAATKHVKAKRGRAAKTGTKLEKAIAMFRENTAVSKDVFIARLVKELDMTPLGAQTYYYNAKKAV